MSLAALKQRKLARIVHHSKLFQQSLDDLTSRGAWAYVQVLGCVLWEIERGATLHSTGLPPSIIRTSFLWRWNRHRARQLELHFNEPCVGTILVLWGKVKILDWKEKKKKNGNAQTCHAYSLLTTFMNRLLLIWELYSFTFCWISVVVNSCFPSSICSSWRRQRGVSVTPAGVSAHLKTTTGTRATHQHKNGQWWVVTLKMSWSVTIKRLQMPYFFFLPSK